MVLEARILGEVVAPVHVCAHIHAAEEVVIFLGYGAELCGCAAAVLARCAICEAADCGTAVWDDDDCPTGCCAAALSVISREAVTIHFVVRMTQILSCSCS